MTCPSTLNCSDHAPKICSVVGFSFAGFGSAIALTACNPTEFKTEAAQVSQLVDSALAEPKTFNYALSNESPNVFWSDLRG